MAIKLPKQWKHWCQVAGLQVQRKRGQARHQWFYLRGHGRVWRLNCYGMLQCGGTYAGFDRWALCTIEQAPMPRSQAEFLSVTHALLAAARVAPSITG